MDSPPTIASLKKRLEPLPIEAKRMLGSFLSHLAQVDGEVSPGEVKLLEKVYKALGVEGQALYSDLHGAAASGAVSTPEPSDRVSVPVAGKGAAITLDPARIAALQKETEQVSKLLAGVFVEEAPPVEAPIPAEVELETETLALLGLDAEHSAFLRTLVSRKSWARSDLADLAADMELMLDGAIERVNEATADSAGGLLLEGDDPVELNREVMEKLPV
jgi:hypothetical protein